MHYELNTYIHIAPKGESGPCAVSFNRGVKTVYRVDKVFEKEGQEEGNTAASDDPIAAEIARLVALPEAEYVAWLTENPRVGLCGRLTKKEIEEFIGTKRKTKAAQRKKNLGALAQKFIMKKDTKGNDTAEIAPIEHNVLLKLKINGITVRCNEFSCKYEIYGFNEHGPILNDHSFDALYLFIQRQPFGFKPSVEDFHRIIRVEGYNNRYHPVLDYLNGLKWDGTSRIDTWLTDYLGAEDTAVNSAIGSKTLIALVRRVKKPGCKFDYFPTLEGPQGIGKSSALKALCPDETWFTDNIDLRCSTKEIIEQTRGKWIVECPELAGMHYAEVEKVKAKLSRQVDSARMAYERFSTEEPRQCVLFGSTNDENYLLDKTGNRRFWPFRCTKIDLVGLKATSAQLWAEAVVRECENESIFPDNAILNQQFSRVQKEREVIDAWIDKVAKHLSEIRDTGYGFPATTLVEVYENALRGEPSTFDSVKQKRVMNCMRDLNWKFWKKSNDKRLWAHIDNIMKQWTKAKIA